MYVSFKVSMYWGDLIQHWLSVFGEVLRVQGSHSESEVVMLRPVPPDLDYIFQR